MIQSDFFFHLPYPFLRIWRLALGHEDSLRILISVMDCQQLYHSNQVWLLEDTVKYIKQLNKFKKCVSWRKYNTYEHFDEMMPLPDHLFSLSPFSPCFYTTLQWLLSLPIHLKKNLIRVSFSKSLSSHDLIFIFLWCILMVLMDSQITFPSRSHKTPQEWLNSQICLSHQHILLSWGPW